MALENLYQCSDHQRQALPERLSEAFYNHPLFQVAFPDESKRSQCMQYFFKQYLDAIAPEALFLADSEQLRTVMIVCDSRRHHKKESMKRLLKMNLRLIHLLPMIGLRQSIYLIRHWDMFSHRWFQDFKRNHNFHLNMIISDAAKRNKGIAEWMVRELIDEGDIMDMDISAEVYQKEMALWLEKMGFILMNTIVDEENHLHQYCLIAQHHKE